MQHISSACDSTPQQTEGKASPPSQNVHPRLAELIFVCMSSYIFFALMD